MVWLQKNGTPVAHRFYKQHFQVWILEQHLIACKLFVLDRNTWNHITVYNFFVLEKINLSHLKVVNY